MNIDFNKALEQLAEAFNTTVEHLYPILIKQAYVAGVQSILVFLVPLVMMIIVYKLAMKSKKECNEGDKYSYWEWNDEGMPYLIMLGLLGFVSIFTTAELIYTAPTAFLNPEYWAIKEVMDAISPK